MPRQPKRIPGQPDERVDPDAAMRVVREAELRGHGPSGQLTRAVVALLDWRRRRKEQRHR